MSSNKKYDTLPQHQNGKNGEQDYLVGGDGDEAKSCGTFACWAKTLALVAGGLLLVGVISYWTAWKISPDSFVPYKLVKHPSPPRARLWGNIQRPYPTGAWWLNLGIGNGNAHIAAYPYVYSMDAEGPTISYSASRREVKINIITDIFAEDLRFLSASSPEKMYVLKYDSIGVTERYELINGNYFDVIMVKGSPYTTIEYSNVKPSIRAYYITYVNGASPHFKSQTNQVTGKEFVIVNGAGQTWMIFAEPEITFRFSEMELWTTQPYTGVLRAAFVADVEDIDLLREYQGAYATGADVDIKVEGDGMVMKYNWKKEGSGELLMLALPHHMDILSDGVEIPPQEGNYMCIKGKMTPLVGDAWTLVDSLPTIGFDAPTPITNEEWADKIREQVRIDVKGVPPIVKDSYGFGKGLGRMARIALIANQVNETATLEEALGIMTDALTAWLNGTNEDALLYDQSWGGLVPTLGVEDEHANFGAGYYNDHHFHYGYFIYSAAVICRFQPSYCSTYSSQLDFIIADIANSDPNSKFFPLARHKDFFDSHSWAAGIFEQGNGKNQESISEAINAYYGVYLYGLATKNQGLADWGRVLTQMELRAGHKYWQMPMESEVYDAVFRSNKMAGVISEMDIVHQTWFGANPEYVHGINMMPFTPISEALLSPEYIAQEYPTLVELIRKKHDGKLKVADEWRGIIYLGKAIVEPEETWKAFKKVKLFDGGNSLVNSLYWIATRPPNGLNMTDPFRYEAGLVSPQCQDNSACAVLGLKDLCCPTATGVYLECCPTLKDENDEEDFTTDTITTSSATTSGDSVYTSDEEALSLDEGEGEEDGAAAVPSEDDIKEEVGDEKSPAEFAAATGIIGAPASP